jgi:hypothetical protein
MLEFPVFRGTGSSDLLQNQLRVALNVKGFATKRDGTAEAGDEASILAEVVGALITKIDTGSPDGLFCCHVIFSVQDGTDSAWPWISDSSAVKAQDEWWAFFLVDWW